MNEKIKQIFEGLKAGEPYQFSLRGNKLIIGVRANLDENYDEYEIFECPNVKKVKQGIFKLTRKEKCIKLDLSAPKEKKHG